jgi:hypothetical protein
MSCSTADFDEGPGRLLPRSRHRPQDDYPEARAALQLAGQLLRESVLGLDGPEPQPQRIPQSFPHRPAATDGPESPLNFSRGVDEALVRLLNTTSTRAGSVEAMREIPRTQGAEYRLARRHAGGVRGIPRNAWIPRSSKSVSSAPPNAAYSASQNKGKYWDLYIEMFPGLAQRPADGFPHVFTETFAKAYDAKLRTLVPPRRSTFGADRNEPIEPDGKAVGDL